MPPHQAPQPEQHYHTPEAVNRYTQELFKDLLAIKCPCKSAALSNGLLRGSARDLSEYCTDLINRYHGKDDSDSNEFCLESLRMLIQLITIAAILRTIIKLHTARDCHTAVQLGRAYVYMTYYRDTVGSNGSQLKTWQGAADKAGKNDTAVADMKAWTVAKKARTWLRGMMTWVDEVHETISSVKEVYGKVMEILRSSDLGRQDPAHVPKKLCLRKLQRLYTEVMLSAFMGKERTALLHFFESIILPLFRYQGRMPSWLYELKPFDPSGHDMITLCVEHLSNTRNRSQPPEFPLPTYETVEGEFPEYEDVSVPPPQYQHMWPESPEPSEPPESSRPHSGPHGPRESHDLATTLGGHTIGSSGSSQIPVNHEGSGLHRSIDISAWGFQDGGLGRIDVDYQGSGLRRPTRIYAWDTQGHRIGSGGSGQTTVNHAEPPSNRSSRPGSRGSSGSHALATRGPPRSHSADRSGDDSRHASHPSTAPSISGVSSSRDPAGQSGGSPDTRRPEGRGILGRVLGRRRSPTR